MVKKFIKLFFLFCFSAIIIPGCGKNDAQPKPLTRVVTRVDISCQKENMLIERHYTDSRKMEYVLLYLRLLKPLGKPDTDPDQLDKDIYEITVSLSDGSQKNYRQKAHKYFSWESRPWQKISPAKASGLYALMQHLPSDTVMAYL